MTETVLDAAIRDRWAAEEENFHNGNSKTLDVMQSTVKHEEPAHPHPRTPLASSVFFVYHFFCLFNFLLFFDATSLN